MPRCVRNFWVDIEIDGKENNLSSGPRSADGGIEARFYIRDSGGVHYALRVVGRPEREDYLTLQVYNSSGRLVHEVVTER